MDQAVAKAELHCHFEGTITPALMHRLAKRNGIEIPDNLVDADGAYIWTNFNGFLDAYDRASSVIRTPQDYYDITFDYLTSAAAEGAIYVEMFTSPDHAAEVGIGYTDMNAAIARAIDDAEQVAGIVGRMVATCVRHLGPDQALRVAETITANPHPYVVGFGMGGDEARHAAIDFAPAFDLAFAAGLSCTVHAGEVMGAASVEDALDALPVVRIGHGIRAIENLALVERLVAEGITLEVCPGSNLALGLYPDTAAHPLRALMKAGCRITLGSDDPPFFHTSIGAEYARATSDFGLSRESLVQFTRTAIDAAFVDEPTKARLREKL
ncbi:MAG: adenosine deaminase [Rhodospirillales bacterium]|nr:adenosine deaminase [Rhodospirillales bacterium]